MEIAFNSDSNVPNKSGDPSITYVAFKDRIKILQESWTSEVKTFKGKIQPRIGNYGYEGSRRVSISEVFSKIENVPLFARIDNITVFRTEHSELVSVIDEIFSKEE